MLLRPIEHELAIPRSALSLVFGLATAGFTVGSVSAAFLYRVASAPILVLLSAAAAAGGIAVAATASGLAQLLVGYGMVFGTGGGIAYILLQQGVNMLVQRRRGLVNGYIVSLYPMGAMIATPAFHACNEAYGWRTTLAGLAAVVAACGMAAAALARLSGARLAVPAGSALARPARLGVTFYKLSATFFLAASAGLMVLSQAREIVGTYGGTAALAVGGMVGTGYGFVSGSTAGGIGIYWRPADYGRVAGRTYVAWCLAAISLPVLAGYLFDRTGGYGTPVLIAAGANLAGMALALTMPKRGLHISLPR